MFLPIWQKHDITIAGGFTPFSSGTFSLSTANVVTGTTISISWANSVLPDIATGLSTCLLKDGTQTVTGNITFSGFNLLNTPVHIGGTAVGSSLELRSTTAAGTTSHIKATVGSNGATEAWRVLNGGQTVFGAATLQGSEFHSVQTTGNTVIGNFYSSNATYSANGLVVRADTAAGTGFSLFVGQASGPTSVFVVAGNGNVTNTNNSYGAISDAKLKTVIGMSGSQWDDVKALGALICKFVMNDDPNKTEQIGWVAQEVQQVSPGLVIEYPDREEFFEDVEVDALVDSGKKGPKGEPILVPGKVIERRGDTRYTGTVTLGVQHSVAMLKMFKAFSEAQARIEALEAMNKK